MRRVAGALVALAVAGCGSAAPDARLTVFAAASLTEVLPQIDERPRYSFAGSDELAVQLREGAPADVYAAARPSDAAALHAEGLVAKPRVFATNRLVLIVPKANPARISSVEDLEQPRVKLVVAGEGVPAGDYTREALARLNAEHVLTRVVSEEQDVKAVASKVALGEADAGFVYATDAAPVAGRVRVIELPRHAQPRIEYVIAAVRRSDDAGRASAFVAEVVGPRGRAVLRRAGFGVP